MAAAKKQVERDNVLGIFGLSLSSTQGAVIAEMRKVGRSGGDHLQRHPRRPAAGEDPSPTRTGVVFEVAGEAIGELIKNIKPNGKVVGMTFDSVGGRAAISHNKRMARSSATPGTRSSSR